MCEELVDGRNAISSNQIDKRFIMEKFIENHKYSDNVVLI